MVGKLAMALCAGLLASAAVAQERVAVDRAVYVERSAGGERTLEPARQLKRGDRVVLMLAWSADRDAPFTVSSRVPSALTFKRGGGSDPEVSTDGGRSWAALDPARAADVTHLRWRVTGREARQGRGMLTYSAVVR